MEFISISESKIFSREQNKLLFSKFYDTREKIYIFKYSINEIRKQLGYHNSTIKNIIKFMEEKKIINETKSGIVLNHYKFMEINKQYFEKEEIT